MRKTIILYGLLLAGFCAILKFLEFRMLVRDLSMEVYVGTIAILFTVLGIWIGNKIVNRKNRLQVKETTLHVPDALALEESHISPREFEVLQLMAAGYSNQEIASKLYVSLNTVKTHSSNLFGKLDVKRRTQAVQRAKELQLIP